MSNVVVFGYSGYSGGHITEELLSRGHSVVGVARKLITNTPARSGLKEEEGSVHDPSFVERVTKDGDAIVVALPAPPDGQPELASVLPSLLTAAARSGARLGVVGGGATLFAYEGGPRVRDLPTFPAEHATAVDAHLRALDVLRAYDGPTDWFYLAPPMGYGPWNPGTRTGSYRLGDDVLIKTPGTAREAFDSNISGPDFANAFADEIENAKHRRAVFTVGY